MAYIKEEYHFSLKAQILNAVKDYFLYKWCMDDDNTIKSRIYRKIVYAMWKLA